MERGGKEGLCQRGKQAKAAQEQEHAGLEHRGGRHGLVWAALDEGVEMCWELLSFWVCRVSVALRAHLICLARRPVVVVVVMVVVVGELLG